MVSKKLGLFVTTAMLLLCCVTICNAENYIVNEAPKPAALLDIETIKSHYANNVELTGYKSIKPYPNSDSYYELSDSYSTRDVIFKIQDIEKDVEEYLANASNSLSNKEKIYKMYMENLLLYTSFVASFDITDYQIEFTSGDWDYGMLTHEGVNYKVNHYEISLAYPHECRSIIWASEGEGFISPIVDARFQYKLSLYLDVTLQNYWQLRYREQTDKDGSLGIYSDGERVVEIDTLAEWITAWSNFQKQNTRPELNADIEERIKQYIEAFMAPNVYDDDNWGEYAEKDLTVPEPTRPLTARGRAEFNRLLHNLPKDSYAYNAVNKAYNILKNNNYTTSKEYYAAFPKEL